MPNESYTATRADGADVRHILAIHRQMRLDTRRFVVAVETATEADRRGRLRPLARWAVGFGHELHVHHWVEDDFIFPELSRRRPDVAVVIDELAADHEVVAGILERWEPAVRALADPAVPFAHARAEVLELAVRLRDLLAEHLDVEDRVMVPANAEAFTHDEFEALLDQVHQQLPKQGITFALPWNVEALEDPADRRELLAGAPLPLRALYVLTRGRFRRLVAAAFHGVPVPA